MPPTLAPEVALGRAALNLTGLLDREMDAIFQDLLQEEIYTSPSLEQKRAVSANRIVLCCRSLAEEIRRYERLRWLRDHDHDSDNLGDLSDPNF
jgi:hypothetical protein